MALKVDYYAMLSRAVARIDRDSYAARGAVYDREHKILLRRLFSADPPHSDIDIAREQQAFRDAVRRIEFGDDGEQATLVPEPDSVAESARRPQREISPEPTNGASRNVHPEPPNGIGRKQTQEPPQWTREPVPEPPANGSARKKPAWLQRENGNGSGNGNDHVRDLDTVAPFPLPPPAADDEPIAPPPPKRRSVAGRVLMRAFIAVILIGAGTIGYGIYSGELDLPTLENLKRILPGGTARTAPGAGRAIYYEEDRNKPRGNPYAAKAVWQLRTDAASGQTPETVVTLDIEAPQRGLSLALSMRREGSAAMSHLVEFRFAPTNEFPANAVARVGGLVFKTAEDAPGEGIAGHFIKVAPGIFFLGLSAFTEDVRRNLELIAERPWIDIPIVMADGKTHIVAVEKGADGERVLKDAIARWSQ
jgi:hypothetical protein